MKRRIAVVTLVATALFGGAASAVEGDGTLPVDRVDAADYPTVVMEVSAPSGLEGRSYTTDDFTVLEASQEVTASVTQLPTDNLEVLLVIDTSGSMRGEPLAAAKRAVADFVSVLPAEVRVGVVGFGAAPELVATPTTDRFALASAVDGLSANGDTALYDAVAFSATQFTAAATDRAVVLLSDGGDTASVLDLPMAIESAKGIRYSAISLITDTSNEDALAQIAEAGQGSVSSAADPAGLAELYRQAGSALVNRYRIEFASASNGPTSVVVKLATPDGELTSAVLIELPAAPATVPTTQAPLPSTTPAPTTPPTTAAPTVRRAADVDSAAIERSLILGAAALFVALFLVVLIAMPRDRTSRRAKANLILRSGHVAESSLVVARERLGGQAAHLIERSGKSQPLAAALDAAGLSLAPAEFAMVVFAAAVFLAVLGLLLAGPLMGIAVFLGAVLLARVVLRTLAEQRRERFLEQLPDMLSMLTASLRSGYGLLQAIDGVATQIDQPMRGELRRVLLEQRVGVDVPTSFDSLAARMRSKDFEWVADAVEINRDIGGDLAAILDNVAMTIRNRRHLARQVKTLSAEGRISAYVLLFLPVAVAGLLAAVNPDYIGTLASPVGLALVGGAIAMMVIGWIWMRRLIKVEF